ncbi:unnamed protein product, partial [Echinostoma caproni]|uniref:Uncharacterized protein n=1 Tax=Echinostoma caproni TaxID=27848 RepID=A0A183A4A6_9TREM
MPSNPGTLPNTVGSETQLLKSSLSNGPKTTANQQVVKKYYHLQEEHQQNFVQSQNNQNSHNTEKQINHIQNTRIINNVQSGTSKSKLKARELPHLAGPTNRDLFAQSPVAVHHVSSVSQQNRRSDDLSEELTSFASETRPISPQSGFSPSPEFTTSSNAVFTNNSRVSPSSPYKSPMNARKMLTNDSRVGKRVEYHTRERVQSAVTSAPPAEDIVESVMPLEGNQQRLKLFEAPPWMKRAAHHSTSSTGRHTPSVTGASTTEGSSNNTTVVERRHVARASPATGAASTSHFRRVGSLPHSSTHSKRLSSSVPAKTSSSTIKENEIVVRRNGSFSPPPRRVTTDSDP